MKKFTVITALMFVSAIIFSGNAFAIALGGYLDAGGGSGELEFDDSSSSEFDVDSLFFGIGFLLETNAKGDKGVFSYRLQVGLEGRDLEDDAGDTFETGGLLVTNTFAFGGGSSDSVRFWGGPQVLLGFYAGELDEEVSGDTPEITYALFGLGLAGGINFTPGGGNLIIPVTLGARIVGYGGEVDWQGDTEDISGTTTDLSISVGVMFEL